MNFILRAVLHWVYVVSEEGKPGLYAVLAGVACRSDYSVLNELYRNGF